MVYLTAEATKRADELGISDKGMKKLFKIAKEINKFQKDVDKSLEMDVIENESDEYERE